MQAAPGFFVELVEVGFQVSDQGGTVQLAFCGLAQAVEFKQHVAAALEKEKGVLYDWMRDVWQSDFDVLVYTLQEGVASRDEATFEQYWNDQFTTLLNAPSTGKEASPVAQQVIAALRAQIEQAKQQGN